VSLCASVRAMLMLIEWNSIRKFIADAEKETTGSKH
jgi:hypothetical protein